MENSGGTAIALIVIGLILCALIVTLPLGALLIIAGLLLSPF